jgi:hypothetical protein
MSLDDIAEILSWGPLLELEPAQLNAVLTIARVFLLVGAKAGLPRPASATGSASLKNSRAKASGLSHPETSTGKTGRRPGGCENLGTGSKTACIL